MKLKISQTLNERLRSEVRNYNKRLSRLEKVGINNLPSHQKVSEIKSRYTNTNDLIKEINRLSRFNRAKLDKVNLNDETKAAKWQIDYLKTNLEAAGEFFEQEFSRVEKKIGRFPGEKTYLDTLAAKINLLDKPINDMTQSQIRSAVAAVNEFAENPTRLKTRYRGFLSEVEWAMQKLGYSDEDREKFFNKFNKLTPSQFLYAYDNNDIIARVYELYHKDYGDEDARLTVEEEDARNIIDSLLEQADYIIKDAQDNMV